MGWHNFGIIKRDTSLSSVAGEICITWALLFEISVEINMSIMWETKKTFEIYWEHIRFDFFCKLVFLVRIDKEKLLLQHLSCYPSRAPTQNSPHQSGDSTTTLFYNRVPIRGQCISPKSPHFNNACIAKSSVIRVPFYMCVLCIRNTKKSKKRCWS